MRRLCALLAAVALLLAPATGFARDPDESERRPIADIFVDGQRVPPNPPPIIENDRLLVPVRALSEALGARVQWEGQLKRVFISNAEHFAEIAIDSPVVRVDGWDFYAGVPARIVGGRTYLPLRMTAEALGAAVEWNPATRTARVFSNTPAHVDEHVVASVAYGYATSLRSCANVLCVNPGNFVFGESPGVIRTLLYHVDIANEIAVRTPVETDKRYDGAEATLALAALPLEAYKSASASSGVAIRPSPSLVAILLSLLALKGDSNPDIGIIQEAQDDQRARGYRPDEFEACTLKPGFTLFFGHPTSKDNPWYTNYDAVKSSQFDAKVLFQSVQVPPSMTHGGYRFEMREVEVTREIRVACGIAKSNRVVRTEGGQRVYAGDGGARQYYIPEAARSALRPLLRRITLDNWRVLDWKSLLRGA